MYEEIKMEREREHKFVIEKWQHLTVLYYLQGDFSDNREHVCVDWEEKVLYNTSTSNAIMHHLGTDRGLASALTRPCWDDPDVCPQGLLFIQSPKKWWFTQLLLKQCFTLSAFARTKNLKFCNICNNFLQKAHFFLTCFFQA